MHPRLENIDFYKGKFRNHANGCRVAKAPCTKYAAYAQKWKAPNMKPSANNKKTPRGQTSFYVDKRPTFEKTCYTSAAKWEVRALGGSTIIFIKKQ